jgi:hypothetical protein
VRTVLVTKATLVVALWSVARGLGLSAAMETLCPMQLKESRNFVYWQSPLNCYLIRPNKPAQTKMTKPVNTTIKATIAFAPSRCPLEGREEVRGAAVVVAAEPVVVGASPVVMADSARTHADERWIL